jgi:O-antigen/teichoic acid export membrane protein
LLLIRLHSPYAQRLLSPLPFGLLLLSMNINQVVGSMALYLRAHKQEKFLLNSVLGAIYIAATAIVLGRAFGPLGITVGQFAGTVIIGLGLGSYAFLKYRRLWHAV